jgi:Family of unknown function (DUF5670)
MWSNKKLEEVSHEYLYDPVSVLLVAWLLGISVFHVAGVFIHILLIVAVISLIMHFVRGRTTSA